MRTLGALGPLFGAEDWVTHGTFEPLGCGDGRVISERIAFSGLIVKVTLLVLEVQTIEIHVDGRMPINVLTRFISSYTGMSKVMVTRTTFESD